MVIINMGTTTHSESFSMETFMVLHSEGNSFEMHECVYLFELSDIFSIKNNTKTFVYCLLHQPFWKVYAFYFLKCFCFERSTSFKNSAYDNCRFYYGFTLICY